MKPFQMPRILVNNVGKIWHISPYKRLDMPMTAHKALCGVTISLLLINLRFVSIDWVGYNPSRKLCKRCINSKKYTLYRLSNINL